MLDLYKNIRERRIALGISQDELAKRIGYTSRTSIAKIEAGQVDIPQSKIEAFAAALQTTPAQLVGWNSDNENEDVRIAQTLLIDRLLREEGYQIYLSIPENEDDEVEYIISSDKKNFYIVTQSMLDTIDHDMRIFLKYKMDDVLKRAEPFPITDNEIEGLQSL